MKTPSEVDVGERAGGGTRIGRRAILRSGVCLGLSLAATRAAAQGDAASSRPREGDVLVRADDPELKPLGPDDLIAGAKQMLAWAMDPADNTVRKGSRLNQLLLVRIDADKATPETQSRAAGAVVAYTAICTHTGCEVIDWLADEGLLYCPCHFSKFDPRDGAKVVDGPAPRSLPALPLRVMDGKLVVAKPFTTRVGFEPA
jgi:Rieske Fe-S protein